VHDINRHEDTYTQEDGTVAELIIRLDRKGEIIERKVFSLLELLEALGGL
jgi:hypothetical protein